MRFSYPVIRAEKSSIFHYLPARIVLSYCMCLEEKNTLKTSDKQLKNIHNNGKDSQEWETTIKVTWSSSYKQYWLRACKIKWEME